MRVTNAEIREKYVPELTDRVRYLEYYRALDVPLTALDRKIMWLCASDVVNRAAKGHYKRRQHRAIEIDRALRDEDGHRYKDILAVHTDRVLRFITFIRDNPERDINWLVDAYTRRFGMVDNREQQSKRKTVGASFTHDVVWQGQDTNDWDYGTYTQRYTPPERPGELSSMIRLERIVRDTFDALKIVLTPQELFGILVEMDGVYGEEKLTSLARQVTRFWEVRLLNAAVSLEREVEYGRV